MVNQEQPKGALEEGVEEAAEELEIHLPHSNLPLPIKVIALFTLIGGLSILGSIFVDIFTPGGVGFFLYIWRIVTGAIAVFIAYGLVHKERWAVWLYGILVVVALFLNFFAALLPAAIVAYLYRERQLFRPSFFDALAVQILNSFKRTP